MAVANAAFDEISRPELLRSVQRVSAYFGERLDEMAARYPQVVLDRRGKGLLIGLKVAPNNRLFMSTARQQGVLVAGGGDNCVRLLPPLIITEREIDIAVERLAATCEIFKQELAAA